MSIRVVSSLNLGGLLPERVTEDALQDAADHILEVAQEKAPLLVDVERANRHEEPGTLRDSGYARVVDGSTAHVGFTDPISARQHEDTHYHHVVGQSKFLEGPLATEKDEAVRIMADRIREGLGK